MIDGSDDQGMSDPRRRRLTPRSPGDATRGGSAYRDSSALALGSLVSGLAAYAFIGIGTRSVGAAAFAAVSVLWTLWAMSAAVFTFPVQHWVIRTVEADGGENRVRRAIPSLLQAAAGLGVVLGAVSWIGREAFFSSDGWVFPLLAAVIPVGSVLMGLNRGVLASRRRFRETALAIVGENLIRVAAAVIVSSAVGLGVGLIAGFAIALAWPSSFKLDTSGSDAQAISPLAFVGGVAGGSLIGQIVLTSGPLFLALVGGTPVQITGLFSALALFRAPYMIGLGVSPRLTAGLTRLALDKGSPAMGRLTLRTLAAAAALGSVAAALGATIGPSLLSLVFGPDVVLGATTTAVVAAASALALCSLFLTLTIVAAARVATVSAAWAVSAVAGGAYLAGGLGSPVDTVAVAFLVAESVAVGSIALALVRPPRPRGVRRSP
jgi:O-antigen/teichoic acid export membrane protein